MKKKILTLLFIAIMTLSLVGCGKKEEKSEDNKQNSNEQVEKENNLVRKLYDMLEVYFIPDVYPNFASYNNSNFYMDKEIKYEDLSDESKLYYAYNTIENIERKNFNSCNELKGYSFNGKKISNICESDNEVIQEGTSGDWRFENVDEEMLEKAYHNMYGQDKKMPLTSFTKHVIGACVYSKEKANFLCFTQTGSDTSLNHGETKYERFVENEDSIEIYDRYIWTRVTPDGESYYKSRFNEKELINSKDKDFSKGALYKHTFKKDKDGNYYWYSSERVE